MEIKSNQELCGTDAGVEYLKTVYFYDQSSKSCLRWLSGKRAGKEAAYLLRREVGTDYWSTVVSGRTLRVHRVIWALLRGPIPDSLDIDHLNGDGLDNRVANLRAVTRGVNQRNRGSGNKNLVGCLGVSEEKSRGAFVAVWVRQDGKQGKKRFFISKYGREESLRLAIEFRKNKIQEMQIAGAGYSSRHLLLSGVSP